MPPVGRAGSSRLEGFESRPSEVGAGYVVVGGDDTPADLVQQVRRRMEREGTWTEGGERHLVAFLLRTLGGTPRPGDRVELPADPEAIFGVAYSAAELDTAGKLLGQRGTFTLLSSVRAAAKELEKGTGPARPQGLTAPSSSPGERGPALRDERRRTIDAGWKDLPQTDEHVPLALSLMVDEALLAPAAKKSPSAFDRAVRDVVRERAAAWFLARGTALHGGPSGFEAHLVGLLTARGIKPKLAERMARAVATSPLVPQIPSKKAEPRRAEVEVLVDAYQSNVTAPGAGDALKGQVLDALVEGAVGKAFDWAAKGLDGEMVAMLKTVVTAAREVVGRTGVDTFRLKDFLFGEDLPPPSGVSPEQLGLLRAFILERGERVLMFMERSRGGSAAIWRPEGEKFFALDPELTLPLVRDLTPAELERDVVATLLRHRPALSEQRARTIAESFSEALQDHVGGTITMEVRQRGLRDLDAALAQVDGVLRGDRCARLAAALAEEPAYRHATLLEQMKLPADTPPTAEGLRAAFRGRRDDLARARRRVFDITKGNHEIFDLVPWAVPDVARRYGLRVDPSGRLRAREGSRSVAEAGLERRRDFGRSLQRVFAAVAAFAGGSVSAAAFPGAGAAQSEWEKVMSPLVDFGTDMGSKLLGYFAELAQGS